MEETNLDIPVTINPRALIISRDKAGNIALSPEAKTELDKILYVKKLIEDIYEHVQEKLSEQMAQENLQKIQAGNITIAKRFYGERYKVANKEVVREEFVSVREYVKPNIETIETYVQTHGALPMGIELRERAEKVSITERNQEE